jgi:formiminotetrahydrofolate cyclodeaminase
MVKNESLQDLLTNISSKSPAPGGGSVAALSGCFGAALVSMVCNLTIGKKKYKGVEEEFKLILGESEELGEELLKLSEKDVEAFNEVMKAYKLPDGEDKTKNLEDAYQMAASVPHDTAVHCMRIMELAKITAKSGNKNAQTDSAVGALMAYSGLRGAILNIKINLKSIQDKQFIDKMNVKADILEKKGDKLLSEIIFEIEPNLLK